MSQQDISYLETSILSALLKEPSRILEIEGVLSPRDFQGQWGRLTFQLIQESVADGRAIDMVVLVEKGIEQQFIIEVYRSVGVPENVAHYASALRERRNKQAAITAYQKAAEKLQCESAEEVSAWLDAELVVSERHSGSDYNAQDVIRDALQSMDKAQEQRKIQGMNGAPWALESLTNAMGGIDGPRLYIVAARPGAGKTALSQQTAVAAAGAGYGVGICSLEIDASEIGRRWISHFGQANISGISRGYEQFFDDAFKAGQKLADLPLFVDDDSYSLDAVCSRIVRWRRAGKIDLAIVDHIGLVEYSGNKNRNDGLGEVSRRLKKLAK